MNHPFVFFEVRFYTLLINSFFRFIPRVGVSRKRTFATFSCNDTLISNAFITTKTTRKPSMKVVNI